jgi:hypothetical protein
VSKTDNKKKRSKKKAEAEAEVIEEPKAEKRAKVHPRRKGEYTPLEREDAKRYLLRRIHENARKDAGIYARDDFDEQDYEVLRKGGLVRRSQGCWCLTKAGIALLQ